MTPVEEFLIRYAKEFDFYETSSRIAAQALETRLNAAGIRAIVTSRAKNPQRLSEKVRERNKSKKYASVSAVFDDIVDLAGVRVALYFPGDQDSVGRIVKDLFFVTEEKKFPTSSAEEEKLEVRVAKRFSGYWAWHYRVRLRKDSLPETSERYSEALIEVQIASVLMHAWSEVEHDLVYKPLQGALSHEEYSILDELNGLVLSGEIALERLQEAGRLRASMRDREFQSHFDLAAHLLNSVAKGDNINLSDSAIGRIDLLYQLVKKLDLATPGKLNNFVVSLDSDFEKRPLAEQLIDQLLAQDVQRYKIFESIKQESDVFSFELSEDILHSFKSASIGSFISNWIDFEREVREMAKRKKIRKVNVPASQLIKSLGLSDELISASDRLRAFRNRLIHGVSVPDDEELDAAAEEVSMLTSIIGKAVAKSSKSAKK